MRASSALLRPGRTRTRSGGCGRPIFARLRLNRSLGDALRGALELGFIAEYVQVELLRVLLGVLVDLPHLLLGIARQLLVDARDELLQRAHLPGLDSAYGGRKRL